MSTTQKQIHKISDFFDTGWKIISALVMVVAFIVQVALAWYRIGDNATDITNLNKRMEEGFKNETEKRTTRISLTDTKFEKEERERKELENQVDELTKEVYILKGLLSNKK